MLHIEISGGLERREWQGVKALAMIALGEIFVVTPGGEIIAGHEKIEGSPIMPEVSAKIGTDADRPAPPPPTAAAPPAPPAPAAASEASPPPVAAAAAPLNPGAIPPSESLMAAAAANAKAAVDAGAALDSRGFPWDARIHAGTKSTKKDGSWTYKRGTDEALIKAVEDELRAVMAAPAVPAPPTSPGAPEAPTPPTQGVTDPAAAFGAGATAPAPALAEAPPPPAATAPAPPAPSAPPAATPDNITEFARVMRVVTTKQTAGTVNTEMVTAIAQQLGLTSIRDLAKRPDLIPAFEALLP